MTPTQIILHHSLTKDSKTVSWGAIRRYHTETMGWKDIGYQYGIENINGYYEILLGRMINTVGAHTRNQNKDSIGICFIGNFDTHEVPWQQWNLGVKLVKSLCEVLKIPIDRVRGHREYSGYKSCPGKLFSLDIFRDAVCSRTAGTSL